MALDPTFFTLDRAIGDVWGNEELLEEHQKRLVSRCVPRENQERRPHGENDLDILQLALSATEFLDDLGTEGINWLSDHGQQFPDAVRRFLYQTSLQFLSFEGSLPESFVDTLASFLLQSESHVATLNYDTLLYKPLIERQVLHGYDGCLVDGFYNDGFAEENLERLYGHTFGYYLHLHGSPLFIDRGTRILKLPRGATIGLTDIVSSHIVLTHVRHKRVVISASGLLRSYWARLVFAMYESDEIILFGYSGKDKHLNELFQTYSADVPVRVVEWERAGTKSKRERFWKEELNQDVTLVQMENILDFDDW